MLGQRVLQEFWDSVQRGLSGNGIEAVDGIDSFGKGRLGPSWRGQASGLLL
jgi:hypothetical protein